MVRRIHTLKGRLSSILTSRLVRVMTARLIHPEAKNASTHNRSFFSSQREENAVQFGRDKYYIVNRKTITCIHFRTEGEYEKTESDSGSHGLF